MMLHLKTTLIKRYCDHENYHVKHLCDHEEITHHREEIDEKWARPNISIKIKTEDKSFNMLYLEHDIYSVYYSLYIETNRMRQRSGRMAVDS